MEAGAYPVEKENLGCHEHPGTRGLASFPQHACGKAEDESGYRGRPCLLRAASLIASRLLRRSESYRHQFRHARLLHGHAVEHGGDAHRLLAVGDEDELGLDAHLFH